MPQVYDKDLQKTWQVPAVYSGKSGAPTSGDDVGDGYQVGDIWITSANAVYMCADNTAADATWTQLG